MAAELLLLHSPATSLFHVTVSSPSRTWAQPVVRFWAIDPPLSPRIYRRLRSAADCSARITRHSEVVLLLRPPSESCDAGRRHVASERSSDRGPPKPP